jgi:hypothetical protein
MEALVDIVQAAVIDRNGLARAVKFRVERLEIAHEVSTIRLRLQRCAARTHSLERSDDVEQFINVIAREWRNGEARLLCPRRSDDVTFLLESLQRFANRSSTDAQSRGNLGFDDPTTGREQSLHDEIAQPGIHLLRSRPVGSIGRASKGQFSGATIACRGGARDMFSR